LVDIAQPPESSSGSERPTDGPLRYRAATTLGVDFPKRIIELVVTPYETEALVQHQGRMVHEVFSRGAYDGIERRPNRVKLNRDHDITRSVGKAIAFHPSREEGLVAEVQVSATDLGDETLTLANDGVLDVSAGYRPFPGGEKWETRSRVRIVKAYLGHIAMTPDPAYPGARVLAVRNADEPEPPPRRFPNREQVRLWLLEDRFKQLG
jgi:HK97 family phage prohead protease